MGVELCKFCVSDGGFGLFLKEISFSFDDESKLIFPYNTYVTLHLLVLIFDISKVHTSYVFEVWPS